MATNKGKHNALTFPEMVGDGLEKRKTSKLYRAESAEFNDGRISALAAKTGAELAAVATAKRLSLTETDEIKARTLAYVKACEEAAVLPSISGLARSFGMTRRALQICIETHSPAATAEWLEVAKDAFSDVLAEASLRNSCNNITSIFILKAIYGFRESVELVATQQPSVFGDQKSIEQIELEYASLPDGD